MGNAERAASVSQRADNRWEEEHDDELISLSEINEMAKAGQISEERRLQLHELLFPGFLAKHFQAKEPERSVKNNREPALREYATVEKHGEIDHFELL